MRYINIFLIILFVFFFWEHIGRTNDIEMRPTYFIIQLTHVLKIMFYNVGILFGRIGSLVIYLHIEKIFDTLEHVISVLIDLIFTIENINSGIKYVASQSDKYDQIYYTSTIMYFITILLIFWLPLRVMINKYTNK